MTDRAYVVHHLRLLGLVLFVWLVYAVGLPKLLLVLGLGRRFTWLVPLDLWGTYSLLLVLPLLMWRVRGIYRGLATRALQEVIVRQTQGCTYLVLPPLYTTTRFGSEASNLWAHISQLLPDGESLIVELVNTGTELSYLISGMHTTVQGVITQLLAVLPGTQVRRLDLQADPLYQSVLMQGTTVWHTIAPTRAKRQIQAASAQPFLGILSTLAHVPEGGSAGLQLLLRSDKASSLSQQTDANLKSIDLFNQRHPSATQARFPWESRTVSQEQQQSLTDLTTRSARPLWEVCIRVWTHAPQPAMATLYTETLVHAVTSQYTPLNPLVSNVGQGDMLDRSYPPLAGRHWTDEELDTLFHFRGADAVAIAPRLQVARAKSLTPSLANCIPNNAVLLPIFHP